MEWKDISTVPDDAGTHVRGLMIKNIETGAKWWKVTAGHINDYGEFVDDENYSPWNAGDYTHWIPLPPAPEDE